MLGIGGRFAGAKGMVQMPNLANLSPSAATSAIVSAGLRVGQASSSDTGNSGDNDKVFSQSVAAGSLVDYDSEIAYSYYRYVAPAVSYTLDSQKIYYGNPYNEYGCNQQPNQNVTGVPNASNPYFYCRREVRPFRYKLLANGVWDGVSYGGYGVDYEQTWTCEFIANQCGVVPQGPERISSEGPCQPGGLKTVIYVQDYNVQGVYTYRSVPESCTYKQVSSTNTWTEPVSACQSGGGCAAGQRWTYTRTYYTDGTSEITSATQSCCPCEISCVDTPYYYFSCENGYKRCTYRTECRDCNNALVSDTRYSCPSERCCTPYCPPVWTNVGSCISSPYGRYRNQVRTCTASDCTTYTESRTTSC